MLLMTKEIESRIPPIRGQEGGAVGATALQPDLHHSQWAPVDAAADRSERRASPVSGRGI